MRQKSKPWLEILLAVDGLLVVALITMMILVESLPNYGELLYRVSGIMSFILGAYNFLLFLQILAISFFEKRIQKL